jgi:hypothetical protein
MLWCVNGRVIVDVGCCTIPHYYSTHHSTMLPLYTLQLVRLMFVAHVWKIQVLFVVNYLVVFLL